MMLVCALPKDKLFTLAHDSTQLSNHPDVIYDCLLGFDKDLPTWPTVDSATL